MPCAARAEVYDADAALLRVLPHLHMMSLHQGGDMGRLLQCKLLLTERICCASFCLTSSEEQ
jgi:hypothetical protein